MLINPILVTHFLGKEWWNNGKKMAQAITKLFAFYVNAKIFYMHILVLSYKKTYFLTKNSLDKHSPLCDPCEEEQIIYSRLRDKKCSRMNDSVLYVSLCDL